MSNVSTSMVVAGVLARTPEWIRNDLSSKDNVARMRAEETMAAMISAAIDEQKKPQTACPTCAHEKKGSLVA